MNFRIISRQILMSAVTLGLLFSSCKKDKDGDSTDPIVNPGAKKLVKIEEAADTYSTFEYNTDGTVKKMTSFDDGEKDTEMQLSYNANKTVKEADLGEGAKMKFAYTGNQLTRSEIYDNDILVSYTANSFQGGKMGESISYYVMEGEDGEPIEQPFSKTTYTYHSNGDVKEVRITLFNFITEEFELESVHKFEQYDSKINPLAQFSFLNFGFFANFSDRNALVEKVYDAHGNLQETIQNEFTYDAQGYPLTSKTTTTPQGGTAEITTSKFFYN